MAPLGSKLNELLKKQARSSDTTAEPVGGIPGGDDGSTVLPPPPPPIVDPERERTREMVERLRELNAERKAMPEAGLPAAPQSVEETGLSCALLLGLVLKLLYARGELRGSDVAEQLGLPYPGVTEKLLDILKQERAVEIKGGTSTLSLTWRFTLTQMGSNRAREVLQRSQYVGYAPVPVHVYKRVVESQNPRIEVGPAEVRQAFEGLDISDEMMRRLGPAISSGKSMFLYGPPGNGKTTIAERAFRLMSGSISIPHAVEVGSEIIKLYDPSYHHPAESMPRRQEESSTGETAGTRFDYRWVLCLRPIVMVGGELTLESLDLIWNNTVRFYEAPFQLKSNGGILLIDDFGRQIVRPEDLLNRWIVPLEKGVDFLTLHTGKKFEVPFRQLVVFSTNLNPTDLVDEAFLRRLRYKIEVGNPTPEQYSRIFETVCKKHGLEFDPKAVRYLIEKHYTPEKQDLRCCHPRDLLDILVDESKFRGIEPILTQELLDVAWASYFVDYA